VAPTDARERILVACKRVIARSGLHGFRMQHVAKEAGVSIGLLAYHFGDRDGLLQAALDHVNEGVAARARTPVASTAGERLVALLSSEFGENPETREGSIAWGELRSAAVFEAAPARAIARSTSSWQADVSKLVAETGRDPDPDGTALLLTALVEGLSGRWLTAQMSCDDAQAVLRRTVQRLGLLDESP
jgi:AcrR family transcriptional regulator